MPDSFNELEDVKKRIILENDLAYAFLTNIPIVPGHILVVPKRPVMNLDELNENELRAMFSLIAKIKPALKEAFQATGFNHAWNEGKDAGQSIPHVHIHLIPRRSGDVGIYEYEPRKFIYRPGVRETSPEEELKEVAKLIKENL